MKKKILFSICLFIFSFCLFTNKANAFDCIYYKEGNTSTPALVIKNVQNAYVYDFQIPNSPIVNELSGTTFDRFKGEAHYYYFVENAKTDFMWTDFWDDQKSLLLFLSLYPNQNAFEVLSENPDDGDKCPAYLIYESYTSGKDKKTVYAMIHTDDLDIDPSKPVNIDSKYDGDLIKEIGKTITKFENLIGNFSSTSDKGYLLSEKNKDKSIDELVGKYKCLTYTSQMELIKRSIKDVGCDNNQKFNNYYEELNQLCNTFRETQSYADVENNTSTAKNCSKACTNFKDDIAELCQLDPTQGCGSLGPKVVKWIYKIIKWARYIIPIVIIILVMLEYIKALASEDEKAMKDATSHMFTRLMVAAIIFILPFILDFVLNLFRIDEMDVNNLFCQK